MNLNGGINDNYHLDNYIDDIEVNECLMEMYFYLLYSRIDDKKAEEHLEKSHMIFQKLNSEQQEIVKNDIISIIETQKKENEKVKVKKKGFDKYE